MMFKTMRFPRVLLMQPNYSGSYYSKGYFPTGLAYISMALNNAVIENSIMNLTLGTGWRSLRYGIDEFQPSLIGIGMMSFRYRQTYDLIKKIKRFYPLVPIVVGGPHISIFRNKVFEECEAIDYGITLEGEKTIVELCYGDLDISQIKGLLYRGVTKEVLYNGDRQFIDNLDENGFPKYSKFNLNKYFPFRPILSSRGCPYKCIYCSVNLAIGSKFRTRSAQSIGEEFEYWYRRGIREFGIVDDCFTLDIKRVFEICDELEKHNLPGLKILLGNGVRADRVNRELLRRMKEVGFCYIAFGVEGGNNKVLRRLNKGISIEIIESAIADACDLGYKVVLFFLIGSPDETQSDVEDSVKLAMKYPVYDVIFNNLIPFPGTKLYQWIDDNQYFTKGKDYLVKTTQRITRPVFETPELPYRKRKRLHRWANRMVKKHTFKLQREEHYPNTLSTLKSYGLPYLIAQGLARLYWSQSFFLILRRTGLISKARIVKEKLTQLAWSEM